jgi:hypothetical protein
MSKDKNKLEPQDFLKKTPGILDIDGDLGESEYTLWCQKNADNKIIDLKDRFIAILQTQDYDYENNIIVDHFEEDLQKAKELQITANKQLCKNEIEKLATITDQINMLLAQASKVDGADKKLKDFEAKKNEMLAYNKQLKEKINNATTMEEINKCVFNIEEIKEIKGIEDIK